MAVNKQRGTVQSGEQSLFVQSPHIMWIFSKSSPQQECKQDHNEAKKCYDPGNQQRGSKGGVHNGSCKVPEDIDNFPWNKVREHRSDEKLE